MRCFLIPLVAIASAAGPAAGQQAPPLAAAEARTIAPFLDEQTFLVARLDVARLNVEATLQWIPELLGRAGEPSQELAAELAKGKGLVQEWAESFRRAGGRQLYVVVTLADLPPLPVFVVVPLEEGASAETIIKWCGPVGARAGEPASTAPQRPAAVPRLPFRPQVVEQIHGAVFAGSRQGLERIRQGKPAQRPEVEKAFAAAGDAVVQCLLLPTADSRKVVEQMMPTLPEEIGGGPSTAVARGLLWAAAGLQTPPKPSLRVVIQSQDAASAGALKGVIEKALDLAATAAERQPELEQVAPVIKKLLPVITPAVEGDRLVLSLDSKRIETIVLQVLSPAVRQARESAKREVAAHNMMEIVKGVAMYWTKHKEQWPADLDELVREKLISAKLLVNPRRPGLEIGYVYLRPPVPPSKITDPTQVIILHETFEKWDGGIAVAYADGHVGIIRDQELFKKLLAEAKAIKSSQE